jgi:hypothetical protein
MRRPPLAASAALSATIVIASAYTSCVFVSNGCAGGGASILVSPSTVIVAVGGSTTPHASWCHGGRYDSITPRWSLGQPADANIVSVDAATGRITGRRAGTARVIATYEGAEGAAVQVTVR